MIKQTIYLGQETYLSTQYGQLLIKSKLTDELHKYPIEDIGVLLLDHPQIAVTQTLLYQLLKNNTAVIACDEKHMPVGLFQPLEGHTMQGKIYRDQLEATVPLKKALWAQVVASKIENQSIVLSKLGQPCTKLDWLAKRVTPGDATNHEAQAASLYWPIFMEQATQGSFEQESGFRDKDGEAPNTLLNYGYAILRAIVARSLVASGLNPSYGIFHKNQYNAFALADDLMEPYRPYIDLLVYDLCTSLGMEECETLSPKIKKHLLQIPSLDVCIGKKTSPLMIATQMTTASLARCFAGDLRKLVQPRLI
jgi:CRISP-associated protein Cas1